MLQFESGEGLGRLQTRVNYIFRAVGSSLYRRPIYLGRVIDDIL